MRMLCNALPTCWSLSANNKTLWRRRGSFYVNTHTDLQTTNMDEERNSQQLIPVGSIGKIGSFNETLGTWEVYTERHDLYFKANGVSEKLLVPSFLALIGAKTYGLLMNIVAPTKPADLN